MYNICVKVNKMKKIKINMLSNADSVKGQGVGSAYLEQVQLIRDGAPDLFDVEINGWEDGDINHFHSIDIGYYFRLKTSRAISVVYVHFLPETLEGSISLPKPFFATLKHYVVDFYRSADYCVVVNPIFIDELIKYDVPREKIIYIPNFVSGSEFYKNTDTKQLTEQKNKYSIPLDRFIVLGVGQVQSRKGVLDFVSIAEENPDISFVWCGGFSFGSITDGYKELKLVVENPPANVQFLDIIPRDEMNLMFNMADVLFMPSYNELFPMSILEAANSSTPVLLRDLDLYKNILFDFYLKGDNNQQFSSILRKLANDKEYYKKAEDMSKGISDFYSKENVLKQWTDFYQHIFRNRTTNHFISLRKSSKDLEKIIRGKKTMLLDGSSVNSNPFGKIKEGDTLQFHLTGVNDIRAEAKIKSITKYEHFDDDETLKIILKYQDSLCLTAKDIKKFSNKLYLTFVEIDDVHEVL